MGIPGGKYMKWSPIRTGLRAAMAPFLIAGAMGTALAIESGTASPPVNETLSVKDSGHVQKMGMNGNIVTAGLAPASPVAAQITVSNMMHPCDALYQSRRELCGGHSGSKYSLCMSKAADYYADCLSAYK
jgi:hypothetical protein